MFPGVPVGGTGVAVIVAVCVAVGVIVGVNVGTATCKLIAVPIPLNAIKAATADSARVVLIVYPKKPRGRTPMITSTIAPTSTAAARCTTKTSRPSGHRPGIPLIRPKPATPSGKRISYARATLATIGRCRGERTINAEQAEIVRRIFRDYAHGASPRATIFLSLTARAYAFLQGRAYVTPQDVKTIGPDVLRHRLLLSYEAEAEEMTPDDAVARCPPCRELARRAHLGSPVAVSARSGSLRRLRRRD